MLHLRDIQYKIMDPLLDGFVKTFYTGLEIDGLFQESQPRPGSLKVTLDKQAVMRLLMEKTPLIEQDGRSDGVLVVEFGSVPHPLEPDAFDTLCPRFKTLADEQISRAREWGVRFPANWTYSIQRVRTDQDVPPSSFSIYPVTNYSMGIDLKISTETKDYALGGFDSVEFKLYGTTIPWRFEHDKKKRETRIINLPLELNLDDDKVPVPKQLLIQVVYNAVSRYAENWINRAAQETKNRYDPRRQFLVAQQKLVDQLLQDATTDGTKKSIVSTFYQDPLELLDETAPTRL